MNIKERLILPNRYWYVILTYIIMQFSFLLGFPLLKSFTSLSNFDISVTWSIFSFVMGLIIILFIMKPDLQRGNERDAVPLSTAILWSILGLFMAYFSQIIAVTIEVSLFGIEAGSANTQQIMDVSRAAPLFLIIPAIIAPVLEELIFRKIIFGTLYKRMNFFFAGLLSALIFGFIHGEPQHILIYGSMGFVFAFLYVKTKRILVPIIVHAGMNTIAVLMQYSMTPEEIQKQLDQLQMIFFGG